MTDRKRDLRNEIAAIACRDDITTHQKIYEICELVLERERKLLEPLIECMSYNHVKLYSDENSAMAMREAIQLTLKDARL